MPRVNGTERSRTPGVLLPTLMVLLTVVWFIRRGFIQIGRQPPTHRGDSPRKQG